MNSNQAFEQIVLFSGFEYHRAIDYAQSAHQVESLPDNLLKQLVRDALIDELSLQQILKYLPVAVFHYEVNEDLDRAIHQFFN